MAPCVSCSCALWVFVVPHLSQWAKGNIVSQGQGKRVQALHLLLFQIPKVKLIWAFHSYTLPIAQVSRSVDKDKIITQDSVKNKHTHIRSHWLASLKLQSVKIATLLGAVLLLQRDLHSSKGGCTYSHNSNTQGVKP